MVECVEETEEESCPDHVVAKDIKRTVSSCHYLSAGVLPVLVLGPLLFSHIQFTNSLVTD